LFISQIAADRHGSYTSSNRLDQNEALPASDFGGGHTESACAVPLCTPVHDKGPDHWSRKIELYFFLCMKFSNNR
jgi:hypothetical protein